MVDAGGGSARDEDLGVFGAGRRSALVRLDAVPFAHFDSSPCPLCIAIVGWGDFGYIGMIGAGLPSPGFG